MILSRPHKPERTLSDLEIRAIARALAAAWTRLPIESLRDFVPFDPSMYREEDVISERLVEILNLILDDGSVPGFTPDTFQDVVKDAKLKGEVMPDLRFGIAVKPVHLTNCRRDDLAFLVEAKVFEGKRGLPFYYSKGMQRFVDGLYSRYSDVGMMLAYCTDPIKWPFPTSLEAFISKGHACVVSANGIGGFTSLKPVSGIPWGLTRHQRNFDPSQQFEIRHLWLNVAVAP